MLGIANGKGAVMWVFWQFSGFLCLHGHGFFLDWGVFSGKSMKFWCFAPVFSVVESK